MKFNLDFSVDAWIQGVDIEAKDEKEALEKLSQMSLKDILDEGYVKDFSIPAEDFEAEVIEKTVTVECYDITYDPYDVEEKDLNLAYLPTKMLIEFDAEANDDLDDLVMSELEGKIYDEYSIFPEDAKYTVVEEK